jgi:hypothetical protein
LRGLLCHCRHHLEAEDDAALGAVVREHLMLRHSSLEPSEDQVEEIVSTRAYDLTAMQNRKTVVDGFAFSVLLNEDGAGRLELTKA